MAENPEFCRAMRLIQLSCFCLLSASQENVEPLPQWTPRTQPTGVIIDDCQDFVSLPACEVRAVSFSRLIAAVTTSSSTGATHCILLCPERNTRALERQLITARIASQGVSGLVSHVRYLYW